MITAKFRCSSVEIRDSSPNVEIVKLAPVYAENGPNKEWSKWTPSGSLEMTISNPDAQGQIKAGGEYMIQISEATAEPVAS